MPLLNKFKRKPARKSRAGRKKSRKKTSTTGSWPWLLGAALVVIIAGVGVLNWARTGGGQATLLTLGSDKMYAEVQTAVGEALRLELPGFPGGVANAAGDHDWPAPEFGPGALIRCRRVSVPMGESWWEIQARVADAVAEVGATVLWGERLLPERLRGEQMRPNEELDGLRLDLGVVGRPTHTLVLTRDGNRQTVQWGSGPGVSRWAEFAGGEAPTVALVIDDWGHSKSAAALKILDLPTAVTMAVLPNLSYSRYYSLQGTELVMPTVAAGATNSNNGQRERLNAGCPVEVSIGRRRGSWPVKRREIMLHLPMQPQSYPETSPGPNPILVGMDAGDIRERIDGALTSLTNVTGVNNHMGSAATSDAPTMRALMSVLSDRDLYFVDSLTSARSVAYTEAVRAGIPAERNRIFLDYDNENEQTIKANLERLVQSARTAGFAVGIGHPHPATASVLAREVPRLVNEGVRFVTVSELMALREFRDSLNAAAGGK